MESDQAASIEVDIASDRAGVISMVALFDDLLAQTIRESLVTLSREIDDRIFKDQGPLGNFNARIDFAYALGLYGSQTRATLHNIRRIRNCFAHRHEAKDFTHSGVQELCKKLPRVTFRLHEEPREDRGLFNDVLTKIAFELKAQTRPVLSERLP